MLKKVTKETIKQSIFSLSVLLATIFILFSFTKVTFRNIFLSDQDIFDSVISNNETNFVSRATNSYANINGKTVAVDLFYREPNEILNNPNVGQGLMVWQCIDYKKAHPDEDVYITLSSFHFSIYASVCVDRENKHFGKMKNLYDADEKNGFVRISYMLILAAKYEINVIAIGQIDASSVDGIPDYDFEAYFLSHKDDKTFSGKDITEYLNFKKTKWTSYGDKSAADMMHLKSCSVSAYIDKDGIEHSSAIWLSSQNLDGITARGTNGNDGVQTAVIISDHDDLRRVLYNFTKLMAEYCGQEDIAEFRNLVSQKNSEQIVAIQNGEQISEDEQIVYIGTAQDNVFELYFTPFGGSVGSWDTTNNPYAKYINKLLPSVSGDGYISFAWSNAKFSNNFQFSETLLDVLKYSFLNNRNQNNKLFIHMWGFDESNFDELKSLQNIKKLSLNEKMSIHPHNKDFLLSYKEDGIRHFVTAFSSLNFHVGALSYQINSVIVINETQSTKNNTYVDFGKLMTFGFIDEIDRVK